MNTINTLKLDHATAFSNRDVLSAAFSDFNFNLDDYNKKFLRTFLDGNIEDGIKNADSVKGQTTLTVNLNDGTIDHGRNKYAFNAKAKDITKSFLQSLLKLDLAQIQELLQDFLSEYFCYHSMSFKLYIKNNTFGLKIECCSTVLCGKDTEEHHNICLLFTNQANILKRFNDVIEHEQAISDFKDRQAAFLKDTQREKDRLLAELEEKYKAEVKQIKEKYREDAHNVDSITTRKVNEMNLKFKLQNKRS